MVLARGWPAKTQYPAVPDNVATLELGWRHIQIIGCSLQIKFREIHEPSARAAFRTTFLTGKAHEIDSAMLERRRSHPD
jgi:hypothetical protein